MLYVMVNHFLRLKKWHIFCSYFLNTFWENGLFVGTMPKNMQFNSLLHTVAP